MNTAEEIYRKLRQDGEPNTMSLVRKLCEIGIARCHEASENMTGEEDLKLKGEIRAYRELLRYIK